MGIIADRIGKRKLLLAGLVSVTIATIIFLVSKSPLMIMFSFFCIGIANATFVVLSPLYSSYFVDDDMDKAFSLWLSLGVITQSIGNLMGFIPPILVNNMGISYERAYWLFIALGAVFFIGQYIFFLISVKNEVAKPPRKRLSFFLTSKSLVLKFSMLAFFLSMSLGVFISLFPFYVNQKLGIQSDALGTLLFLSSFASATAQMAAPKISGKFGSVTSISLVIGLAAPFYMLIPFAPSFTTLSLFYIMRLSLVAIADPLISSTYMKNLVAEEKSTANGIRMMFVQGGNFVGPWLGGQLMEEVSLGFPAFLGGGIYAITAVLTLFFLKNVESGSRAERKVDQVLGTILNAQTQIPEK
jgi:MFS family permease